MRLPHQPEVDISDVWTKDPILHLLKDLFPKESHNTNTVNNITVRYGAVVWRFNYADESVEMDTIKNIFTILQDSSQAELSEEQELTIIKLWWKQFPTNLHNMIARVCEGRSDGVLLPNSTKLSHLCRV